MQALQAQVVSPCVGVRSARAQRRAPLRAVPVASAKANSAPVRPRARSAAVPWSASLGNASARSRQARGRTRPGFCTLCFRAYILASCVACGAGAGVVAPRGRAGRRRRGAGLGVPGRWRGASASAARRKASAGNASRVLTRRATCARDAQAKAFLGFGGKSEEETYVEETKEIISQMRVRFRSQKRALPYLVLWLGVPPPLPRALSPPRAAAGHPDAAQGRSDAAGRHCAHAGADQQRARPRERASAPPALHFNARPRVQRDG